jgi:hypothetical protein
MTSQFYIPYFAINPYGHDVPAKAMEAARTALERRLGGAYQVLAARAAFEEAGGLRAYWREIYPPAITRWTAASHHAVDAAYKAEPPRQASIEDIEHLNAAYIDIIACAQYGYSEQQWLDVFLAHFGMSDYCDSHDEAITAARRWGVIAPGACPIAAAEREITSRCPPIRPPPPTTDLAAAAGASLARANSAQGQGAQSCF